MSVVNIHHVNSECLQFDVYVGHTYKDLASSKWANPFSKFHYSEEECVTNFKEHFFTNPHLFLNIEQLKNKVLGCWCNDDELCHARFLSDLANSHGEQKDLDRLKKTVDDFVCVCGGGGAGGFDYLCSFREKKPEHLQPLDLSHTNPISEKKSQFHKTEQQQQ